MFKIIFHSLIFLFLTILSQLGGIAWLIAIYFRRKFIAFLIAYSSFSIAALWVAPMMGREPLPCFENNGLQMQSILYCVLNRQYVVPELESVLFDFSAEIQEQYPNTKTLVLDANFPFLDGFPMLPHLSHRDGRKVDLAFYYRDVDGYLPKVTRSPIGYFAFEDGQTDCPDKFLNLRWNFKWLQPLWLNHDLEPMRMKAALKILTIDKRVGKLFIEPHLKSRIGVESSKIRFQGCRAARHDDHIHLQL